MTRIEPIDATTSNQIQAVRSACGVLERMDSGWLSIAGTDRFTWLQGMVSNDVRLLERGGTRLSACVLDATGHLLSDIVLIRVQSETPYLLAELPRQNVQRIRTIFDRLLIIEDVEITDKTDDIVCFSLQGPDARQTFARHKAGGTEAILDFPGLLALDEADHTGSGGFDIILPAAYKAAAQVMFQDAGIAQVGYEAQEILRVEAGIPKYGQDLDETVIALEANLGPTHISLTKGCYVGQEIIARIDSRGHTNRALTGMVIEGDLPNFGDKIFTDPTTEDPEGKEVGRITSVIACSPSKGNFPIALGYVRHEHRIPGTSLTIGQGAGVSKAEVVALPFYLRGDL